MIQNIPEVKLGLIAVSRSCFPMALAERRRTAPHKACETELLRVSRDRGKRARRPQSSRRRAGPRRATRWWFSWATLALKPLRP